MSKNLSETADEAARARRRLITLSEILAVTAVLISGLTLWLNWTERSDTQAEKQAESKKSVVRAQTLMLSGVAADGGARIDLRPLSSDQIVQSQTIRFPTALGIAAVETTGEPRIQADWFASALGKAREAAKLPDESRGDERLPVMIETRFLVDGASHDDKATYDIGYTLSGRMFGGHKVTLRGLSFVRRAKDGSPAPIDGRWRSLTRSAPLRSESHRS